MKRERKEVKYVAKSKAYFKDAFADTTISTSTGNKLLKNHALAGTGTFSVYLKFTPSAPGEAPRSVRPFL